MMCLKSGLLAESTWALNVLSVLLFDDSTIHYFGLQHMPGLLDVLLDHLRRCLIKIFGDEFEELELGLPKRDILNESRAVEAKEGTKESISPAGEEEEEEGDSLSPKFCSKLPFDLPDQESLAQPDNFTLKTRNGKHVVIENNSQFTKLMFDEKKWDVYTDFDSGIQDWHMGLADISEHVLTHFSSETSLSFHRCQFYRKRRCKSACIDDKENVVNRDKVGNSSDPSKKSVNCGGHCDNSAKTDSLQTSASNGCSDTKDSCPKLELCHSEQSCSNGVDIASKTQCMKDGYVLDNGPNPDRVQWCAGSNDKCSAGVEIKQEPSDVGSIDAKVEVMDTSCASVAAKTEDPSTQDDTIKKESGEELESLWAPKEELPCSGRYCCTSKGGGAHSDSQCLERLKRKLEDFCGEDMEAYREDQPSLLLVSGAQEEISKRCICISNILRSLSFIPGNEAQISSHNGMMMVLGKLLLLRHVHPKLNKDQNKFEREADPSTEEVIIDPKQEWWWDTLHALREDILVILSNISGRLKMNVYPEEICLPILDGLLHWAVCPSSYAQDPLPCMSVNSVLSPQRLVLEALCKLCVTETNVDLLLATPPFSRIVHLFTILIKLLADHKEQVMREFAINLLAAMVQSDSSAARAVALQHPSVSLLLDFVESAEQRALQIASQHGVNMLRDNPEMMGTSLDMLRRAASILLYLARIPENRPIFMQHQQRLLALVMSQILDQHVASILSDVLYNCSQQS